MGFHLIYDDGVDVLPMLEQSEHTSRVKMLARIGEKEYSDKNELLVDMPKSDEPAKTACPSIMDYLEIIEQYAKDNDVYIVTVSSAMSASYSVAVQAAEMYKEEHGDAHICVFDSRSASAGETRVALEVFLEGGANTPFDDTCKRINDFIANLTTLFVINKLDNLVKNGRVSKAVAQLANLAKIKFVGYATKSGEIDILQKTLGLNAAYKKLVSTVKEKADSDNIVVVSQCNATDLALKVMGELVAAGYTNVYLADYGIITSVYGNEGSIEVSF